jgi:hypothetical protein
LNKVKSWAFALWSVAGLGTPLLARDLSADGRTVEKAAVRCGTLVSVVPRVSDREGHKLHPSPVPYEGRYEGGVLIGLLVELNVAAEVPAEADLDDDEGALLSVEGGRVGGVSGTPLA